MRLVRLVGATILIAQSMLSAGVAGTELDRSLADLWQHYRARFVTPAGRVVDNANGNISHSEGQGYAMLFAERTNDRAAFTAIWQWTRDNLFVRGDGLAAWRWDPQSQPHVTDTNNATDGDLLIAWALAEAAGKWNAAEYQRRAKSIAEALAREVVVPSRYGPILLPAAHGFSAEEQPDGPVVNLSYWIFPALARLGEISGAADWPAVADAGQALIAAARFGPRDLPGNWTAIGPDAPAPARNFPRLFGYDAIRIPLYLAWRGPAAADLSMSLLPHNLAVVDLDSGADRERLANPDYQAIAQLADCRNSSRLSTLRNLPYDGQFYYPASLHLLSLVAASDMAPACTR